MLLKGKLKIALSLVMMVSLLCFSGCSAIDVVKGKFFGGQSDNSTTELPGSTITVETAETIAAFLDEDEVELPEIGDETSSDTDEVTADNDAEDDSDTDASSETAADGADTESDAASADDAADSSDTQNDSAAAETEDSSSASQGADVTYEDANETVYTTADTYARNAPGTDGEIAKTIASGTQIRRIAKGSDGWDKVDINGELYYMSSDSLSTTAP